MCASPDETVIGSFNGCMAIKKSVGYMATEIDVGCMADKVQQSQTSAGGGADIGNRIAVFEKCEKIYFTNY